MDRGVAIGVGVYGGQEPKLIEGPFTQFKKCFWRRTSAYLGSGSVSIRKWDISSSRVLWKLE